MSASYPQTMTDKDGIARAVDAKGNTIKYKPRSTKPVKKDGKLYLDGRVLASEAAAQTK